MPIRPCNPERRESLRSFPPSPRPVAQPYYDYSSMTRTNQQSMSSMIYSYQLHTTMSLSSGTTEYLFCCHLSPPLSPTTRGLSASWLSPAGLPRIGLPARFVTRGGSFPLTTAIWPLPRAWDASCPWEGQFAKADRLASHMKSDERGVI